MHPSLRRSFEQEYGGSSGLALASGSNRSRRGFHLTIAVGNGRGVTLALTLLHHGRPEGVQALVRRLPGVGQTLDCPHLLSQAALGRTLEEKTHQSGR